VDVSEQLAAMTPEDLSIWVRLGSMNTWLSLSEPGLPTRRRCFQSSTGRLKPALAKVHQFAIGPYQDAVTCCFGDQQAASMIAEQIGGKHIISAS
jgi:hypothetical protein